MKKETETLLELIVLFNITNEIKNKLDSIFKNTQLDLLNLNHRKYKKLTTKLLWICEDYLLPRFIKKDRL
jgi:hypothetical protein